MDDFIGVAMDTRRSDPSNLQCVWRTLLHAIDGVFRDFSTAQETVQQGVSAGPAISTCTAWDKWLSFTTELQAFPDKVPFLQVFAQRVHRGQLAARGSPVWA